MITLLSMLLLYKILVFDYFMTAVISSETQSVLYDTSIYFADTSGQWVPLPAWGFFFINLGLWVAQAQSRKNRLVLGLAIPIRNYAAAFAALGIVLGKVDTPPSIDSKSHFQQLSSLPIGTAVNYQYGDKRLKGIFQGIEEVYNEQRLRIQTENKRNGGLTHLIRKEESLNVKIASGKKTSLPKKQTGRYIINQKDFDFINAVIGKNKVQYFINNYYSHYSIIGCTSLLKQEIMEAKFACDSYKSKLIRGKLQDILRVRDFFTTENQPYCGEVLSAQVNTPPQRTKEFAPHVIIFDGATGFIKWRDYYRSSHWIVLLERTDVHFQEAVEIINQEYINRVDGEEILNIPSLLFSTEMIVYQQGY